MSRKIYTDPNSIPTHAKVLGIRVRVPRIMFAVPEGVQADLTLSETRVVFVELTDEEWNRVQGNQAAINALGQALGPEIAAALGGYVKAWHA